MTNFENDAMTRCCTSHIGDIIAYNITSLSGSVSV